MSWVAVPADYANDPRVMAAARRLGVPRAAVVGYIAVLAGMALGRREPDGTIDCDPALVASALDVDDGTLATLVETGLVAVADGRLAVIDFPTFARPVLGTRERARRARERRRAAVAANGTVSSQDNGRRGDGSGWSHDDHAVVTFASPDRHVTVALPSRDGCVTVAKQERDGHESATQSQDLVASDGAAPPDLVGGSANRGAGKRRRKRDRSTTHVSVNNIFIPNEKEKNTLTCASESARNDRDHAPPNQDYARSLFRALVEACTDREYDAVQLSRSERGRYNRAVKELVELGASVEEVRRRAQEYRRRWPGVSLTPTALVANWTQFELPRNRQMTPDEFIRAVFAETERLIEHGTKGGTDAFDR
jgi:hypothetical protein